MATDHNDVSQTLPRRFGTRDTSRVGALVVLGSGASLAELGAPRVVVLDGPTIEIGRRAIPAAGDGPLAWLTIPDSTVSGVHARIQHAAAQADLFVIQDLGSTNGTYVDGRRIGGPTPLRDGAVLFFGAQVVVFRRYSTQELDAVQEDAAQPFAPVPTLSPKLAATAAKVRRLAQSDAEILLVGETGVGKEVFARAIHAASRRGGQLVAINCAAIPRELVESELFGYERGAHSTAQGRKTGLVELAHGGTLFLDEIGDMPIELQSKLLRFLQERRFTPLGSTRIIDADVRVVAATSRTSLADGGHVQGALLGRLGAQPIELVPLRERIEDVGRLCGRFVADAGADRAFEPEAFKAIALHQWPLNVRELMKVVREAEVLSRGMPSIGLEHLPDAITETMMRDLDDELEDTFVDSELPWRDETARGDGVPVPVSPARTARVRRRPAPTAAELTSLLAACRGSVAEVARRLDRQYAVVWRCIQRYGIDAGAYRAGQT